VPICAQCGEENPGRAKFCLNCAAPLQPAVPSRREVRKSVTVLFCDVTGSTQLGEKLDPEALRSLLARYFERMKAIVEHHGGTVEKFIGDAVMAVFGVPVVHEDDAMRAVRAAVQMRDAFAGLGIEGRIGVTTGLVVTGTEERLATGDAVNVAARLEQAASPGEILIGEETLGLTRDAVDVEEVEPLQLKGKSAAVSAYRLVAVEAGAAAVRRRLDVPMVGRATELRRLQDAFDQAVRDRSCQLFTVLGAAGVGKSRLAAEFLNSIEDAVVVSGRCLPYGEGITYGPVVEVVQQLPPSEDAELDPLAVEAIANLLGEENAVTSTEEIARAFRSLLEAVAAERTLVAVFDDIHWGEETFLDLVEHVADLSRDVPILLLCLSRPDLFDRRPGWGGGKMNATSVLLEPLAPDETERLIDSHAALDEAMRARILDASEGNPLFIEEMVAMLRESPDSAVAVPPTIHALLAARLDQLGPEEREVLQCGSVEGRTFHHGAVQALAPEEPHVGGLLTTLVRKELVRPEKTQLPGEDAYRFRHLLIRDAAYDALSKSTRAELHERFALWLQEHSEGVVELDEIVGYHLEQAFRYRDELGADENSSRELAQRAAERLGAAGRRAFVRSDAPAAVNLISRAVSLLPADDPARVDLVPTSRDAQGLGGDLAWAFDVLDDAIGAGGARLRSNAVLQRALLRLFTGPDVTVEELVDIAHEEIPILEALGDDLGLARAWRLIEQANYLARRAGASISAAEQALGHARRAGDVFEEREISQFLLVALIVGPTPADEAARRAESLLEEAAGDPAFEVNAIGTLAYARAIQGHMTEAQDLLDRARLVMGGFGEGFWVPPVYFALFARWADDPETAEREARPGYEALMRIGEKSHFSSLAALMGQAVYAQGRYDEADELAEQARAAARPIDVQCQVSWRTVKAKILARRGDGDAAEALAREAVTFVEDSDFLPARADALTDLAEVLRLLGRSEGVAHVVEQALRLHELKGNVPAAARTRLASRA
jgi:class 3 adenylate cyclase/tetratricopeptide (TPR) repeat protein